MAAAAAADVSAGGGVVPEKVMDGVRRTLTNIDELRSNFDQFVSLSSDQEVMAGLTPIQRAHTLLLLAKTSSLLLSVRLRCSGVHPDNHPIKGELDRLSRYEEKLERYVAKSKEPLRPSTTLNAKAATRFIEHSLPDLTTEQRQSMREISNSNEPKMSHMQRSTQKKRKYQSSDGKSVREAAQDFLEKAARELLGENNGGVKGPLGPVQEVDIDED